MAGASEILRYLWSYRSLRWPLGVLLLLCVLFFGGRGDPLVQWVVLHFVTGAFLHGFGYDTRMWAFEKAFAWTMVLASGGTFLTEFGGKVLLGPAAVGDLADPTHVSAMLMFGAVLLLCAWTGRT